MPYWRQLQDHHQCSLWRVKLIMFSNWELKVKKYINKRLVWFLITQHTRNRRMVAHVHFKSKHVHDSWKVRDVISSPYSGPQVSGSSLRCLYCKYSRDAGKHDGQLNYTQGIKALFDCSQVVFLHKDYTSSMPCYHNSQSTVMHFPLELDVFKKIPSQHFQLRINWALVNFVLKQIFLFLLDGGGDHAGHGKDGIPHDFHWGYRSLGGKLQGWARYRYLYMSGTLVSD